MCKWHIFRGLDESAHMRISVALTDSAEATFAELHKYFDLETDEVKQNIGEASHCEKRWDRRRYCDGRNKIYRKRWGRRWDDYLVWLLWSNRVAVNFTEKLQAVKEQPWNRAFSHYWEIKRTCFHAGLHMIDDLAWPGLELFARLLALESGLMICTFFWGY